MVISILGKGRENHLIKRYEFTNIVQYMIKKVNTQKKRLHNDM